MERTGGVRGGEREEGGGGGEEGGRRRRRRGRGGEERCEGESKVVESKILPFAWLRGSTCREFTYGSTEGSTWLVGGNITAQ